MNVSGPWGISIPFPITFSPLYNNRRSDLFFSGSSTIKQSRPWKLLSRMKRLLYILACSAVASASPALWPRQNTSIQIVQAIDNVSWTLIEMICFSHSFRIEIVPERTKLTVNSSMGSRWAKQPTSSVRVTSQHSSMASRTTAGPCSTKTVAAPCHLLPHPTSST